MSWILLEYLCAACNHRTESLEVRGAESAEVPCEVCSTSSPRTVSAVMGRVPIATVERGSGAERPPHAIDTRPLADGMERREWKARRRQYHRERRERQIRRWLG